MDKLRKLANVIGFTFLSACASTLMPPEGSTPTESEANRAWSQVLKENVDSQGRINFSHLAAHSDELNTFVRYVRAQSPRNNPESFPTLESKLAYSINAYNALAMYTMIHQEPIPSELTPAKRGHFFILTDLDIGTYFINLFRFENEFIRTLGDERIHFALNCMVKGCPRLPQVTFTVADVNSQLDREAKRFFNEERNVRVVNTEKKVYLSSILKFYTVDFLKKAASLIDYANQYREQKIPTDYRVDFIPYDWTVNLQPAS